MKLELNS